jgi:branched-chain amino acid transport system permease protein
MTSWIRRGVSWNYALFLALLALLVGVRLFGSEFAIALANYIGLASLVAYGLVLLTGIAGMTSFGQAAFVGIGAYVTAYLSTRFGLNPWIGLVAALGLTGLSAFLIGIATLRLQGHYLPLSTMAWGISLFFLFGNQEELGGHTGIDRIPPISIGHASLISNQDIFLLIWAIVLLSGIMLTNLLNSRTGRAIRTLKGGVVMAESFGIDTARQRMKVFVISAVLAGLSGWLYAHMLRFVSPTPFGLAEGIQYLFMAVLGGASHVWGAIIGAGLVTLSKVVLEDVAPALLGKTGNYEGIAFGAILILLLQYAPNGLLHHLKFWRRSPAPAVDPAVLSSRRTLPRRAETPPGEVLLQLEGVEKRFGGLRALNGVNFDIKSGEIVALIGPNGAGKSTLFDVITGVQPDDGGRISFHGETINGLRSREIARRGVARTFQHVIMMPALSVLENVMIGAYRRGNSGVVGALLRTNRAEEDAIRAEAVYQLRRVGLGDCLHVEAGSLALGQQRILEVARALCADPALLLLDEPAAGLRHGEKESLATLLRQLRAEGITILVVEHDMGFVMNLVDRIVVLDFGERIAEGIPKEIQSNKRVLEAYLGGIE